MKLGEIKGIVSTCIGRGSAYDAQIATMVKSAVRQIERVRAWQYLFSVRNMQYVAGNTKLNLVGAQIRNVDFLRNAERTTYWKQIFSNQVSGSQAGGENAYWIEGANTLVFAYDFGTDVALELGAYFFTDIPDSDDFTCWLFDNGADVVIGKTLLQMSDLIRNAALAQIYTNNMDLNSRTLEQADDDLKFGNMDLMMRT